MGLKSVIGQIINSFLKPFSVRLVNERLLFNWQKRASVGFSYNKVKLPDGADEFLNPKNEKLVELTRLYSQMDTAVITPSVWTNTRVRPVDIKYFRGDNPYVYQYQNYNFEQGHIITTYYIKSIDNLDLFEKLKEDEHFGIYAFEADNKIVSRDLLDSIVEIYFLEKHLGISKLPNVNLLDIGAGYGRLAHRMVEALPNINHYYCTDAVPASTFICGYYLDFRNVADKARTIPLHQIEDVMVNNPIDIAINIHSFSECTIAAIDWWLNLLAKYKVRYLMIVPDDIDPEGELLVYPTLEDFRHIVESKGYRLLAKEPKYRDPGVQRHGVSPAFHYLFELASDI